MLSDWTTPSFPNAFEPKESATCRIQWALEGGRELDSIALGTYILFMSTLSLLHTRGTLRSYA